MYRNTTLIFLLSAISLFAPLAASAVTINTAYVGNVGNVGDVQANGPFGAVAYDYRIGTTEVTNAQYAEFLNAKAASDPLALYNTNMGSDPRGGISRSGVSGSFTYAAKTNMDNKPVNLVSWYDSIRFANWLNNGQGTGDTETGAYTLGALGAGGVPTAGDSITRNVGATWFLTSENEWYKAAYHQPAAEGGDADNYWLYPTASNSAPTVAAAINAIGPTRGDISNPGPNVANYLAGADWNSLNGNLTTVGTAGPLSRSFYGTYDQGGNVHEWNETFFLGLVRGLRGGHILGPSNDLRPSFRDGNFPTEEDIGFGFRVATVPEPSGFVLAALGLIGMVVCKRRKR